MIVAEDDIFLRRALRLAMNGRGHVEPNPMVGCVLVRNGQIIGEGWHAKVGEAHAEPNALADCRSRGNDPAGATAYVTLEPCCHTNKRTPPCAPRLIEAKIARVVIGCLDPNPDVNGQGVAMLRAAGVEVDVLSGPLSPVRGGKGWGEGVADGGTQASGDPRATTPSPPPSPPSTGEREVDTSHFRQLIAPFTLRQTADRPYVTLKWAESADRKVAASGGRRVQISNELSQRLVHEMRSRIDSILVGINTVLTDDPSLNARYATHRRDPFRHVLDRDLRTPPKAKILSDDGRPTTIYCQHATDASYRRRRETLELNDNVTVTTVPLDADGRLDLTGVLARMRTLLTHEMFVEPGPTLAASFLSSSLADRLWVFRSRVSIDERDAPDAARIPENWTATGTLDLAGDTLTEYLNTRSPAFFAAVPSADLVLAAESAARAAK